MMIPSGYFPVTANNLQAPSIYVHGSYEVRKFTGLNPILESLAPSLCPILLSSKYVALMDQ